MKKVIIFDFWGTLADHGIRPSPIRQVKDILRLRIPFHQYIVPFEKVFMKKQYEDLTEAFTEVCFTFGREPKPWLVEKLVGMWNKNKLLAKLYPETLEVLEELKKEHKLVLISNTDSSSVASLIEKFGLNKYFDNIYLSYKTGFLKTDKESYETVLKDFDVKADEALMVGDSIETDIKGAEQAGIKGVLIDRWDKREFDPKIKDLKGVFDFLR